MKTHITLYNCTRPYIEKTLIEANFKQHIDSVASPEELLHLRNHFSACTTSQRPNTDYHRICKNAFKYAAKGTKRKENKQWQFCIEIY